MQGEAAPVNPVNGPGGAAKSLWGPYFRRKCIPKYRLFSTPIYLILPIDRPL
jgi:hypothetical protein